jgi:hypothetical protein
VFLSHVIFSPFVWHLIYQQKFTSTSALSASSSDVAGKYFNLQELEDRESCLTEVFFNPDQSLKIGVTDGPIFTEAKGKWELDEATGSFKMNIVRTFDTGRQTKNPTDMGEFVFDVERVFTGILSEVGGLLAFEGVVHSMDERFGDLQVGIYEMIDTTEARMLLSDEEAADTILSGKKVTSN